MSDGTVTAWGRDEAGRPLAQRSYRVEDSTSEVLRLEYGWDLRGRKTFEKTSWSGAPARADIYLHDDGGQLVAVRYDIPAAATEGTVSPNNRPRAPDYEDAATSFTAEEAWSFDPMGNREWMTVRTDGGVTSSTVDYSADLMNRYTSAGGAAPTYDLNGRPLTSGFWTWKWSVDGRLLEAADSSRALVARFEYDAYGRRVSRTLSQGGSTSVRFYLWDGERVIEERDEAGNVQAEYLWGLGYNRLLGTKTTAAGGAWHSVLTNDLESVRAVVDGTGAVVERVAYSAYGLPKLQDGAGASTAAEESLHTRFLYTGHAWDKDLGLHYAKHRWLDPETGRFLSPSPLVYPVAELNYLYAGNDPVTLLDPNGKEWALPGAPSAGGGSIGGMSGTQNAGFGMELNADQRANIYYPDLPIEVTLPPQAEPPGMAPAPQDVGWGAILANLPGALFDETVEQVMDVKNFGRDAGDLYAKWSVMGCAVSAGEIASAAMAEMDRGSTVAGAAGTAFKAVGKAAKGIRAAYSQSFLPISHSQSRRGMVRLTRNRATDNRVKPRKATLQGVTDNQPRNVQGQMIDPNTGQTLKAGEIDLGHKSGNEWRTRKQMHEQQGSTRKDVIEAENDPDLYQWEDRSSNRSHRYEQD